MANKRQLKKQIRYTCGDMAAELLCACACYDGFDDAQVSEIIGKIAALQVDSLKNISFGFDKNHKSFDNAADYNKARAAYNRAAYRKLRADFLDSVKAIVKEMNAAMPQAVKDENKQK